MELLVSLILYKPLQGGCVDAVVGAQRHVSQLPRESHVNETLQRILLMITSIDQTLFQHGNEPRSKRTGANNRS